ncbi:DUF4142 domain-containing protein [Solitalea canadensis]|uniref:Putative outer membrane protein n=1 Tax=Solitalea canadensis (strain ATCC 29591 / DSM 3403 / JCM 21819 / LMG 8368 / NBRC 15130 / NCIMB 12057 / USAM 9D) TaxID=929556 RepID=H8KVG0_SOLCM|nr:DUF4142 domain-containing protein [Solitalea canadensis]AFD06340.1 putative outer membrane protein [Solitalea canadensis DSM 3403]
MRLNYQLVLLGLIILPGIISCNSNEKAEKNVTVNEMEIPHIKRDADFVVKALNMGMFEVQAAQLAEKKASTKELKVLAAKVESEHSKVNEQLAILATEKNITAPDSITNDMQDKVMKLSQLKGEDFDKEYATIMLNQHREVVDEFEQISINAVDADIKQLAMDALPAMRTHYEEAVKVKDAVEKKYK